MSILIKTTTCEVNRMVEKKVFYIYMTRENCSSLQFQLVWVVLHLSAKEFFKNNSCVVLHLSAKEFFKNNSLTRVK